MQLSAIQKFTLLDFPDRVACIAFTPGCDLRCRFCHNPEFVLPERLCELAGSFIPEKNFFAFLEQRRGKLAGVVVSGGEPTVQPDLPRFLARIKKLDFAVKLDTNGNNPAMLEQLLKEGLVDYIAMDVKTSLGAYPDLVGPGVKPERIQNSIRLILQSGVDHEFRTTLIREHHTDAIIDELIRLLSPARRIMLQRFRPEQTLDPAFAKCHGFSAEETEFIAARFAKGGRTVGVRS